MTHFKLPFYVFLHNDERLGGIKLGSKNLSFSKTKFCCT